MNQVSTGTSYQKQLTLIAIFTTTATSILVAHFGAFTSFKDSGSLLPWASCLGIICAIALSFLTQLLGKLHWITQIILIVTSSLILNSISLFFMGIIWGLSLGAFGFNMPLSVFLGYLVGLTIGAYSYLYLEKEKGDSRKWSLWKQISLVLLLISISTISIFSWPTRPQGYQLLTVYFEPQDSNELVLYGVENLHDSDLVSLKNKGLSGNLFFVGGGGVGDSPPTMIVVMQHPPTEQVSLPTPVEGRVIYLYLNNEEWVTFPNEFRASNLEMRVIPDTEQKRTYFEVEHVPNGAFSRESFSWDESYLNAIKNMSLPLQNRK